MKTGTGNRDVTGADTRPGWFRALIVSAAACAVAAAALVGVTAPAAAYGSTIDISIASTMVLSRSSVEVEFPVTVRCDPINAYETYVRVSLSQQHSGATGSQTVQPLDCDSTPHTYVAHVFADQTPFEDGPTVASAYAQNIAANFVEQDGSATASTMLNIAPVSVSADGVTGRESGSTYWITIGDRAALEYQLQGNGKGYSEAHVPITVACTPQTTSVSSPWIGAALEEADGTDVAVANDGAYTTNYPPPTLICDGVSRTYSWTFYAYASPTYQGMIPGDMSVAVWIEGDYVTPQGSAGNNNADAVNTVHAQHG